MHLYIHLISQSLGSSTCVYKIMQVHGSHYPTHENEEKVWSLTLTVVRFVVSISETADFWVIYTQQPAKCNQNGAKNKHHQVSISSVGGNTLLINEVGEKTQIDLSCLNSMTIRSLQPPWAEKQEMWLDTAVEASQGSAPWIWDSAVKSKSLGPFSVFSCQKACAHESLRFLFLADFINRQPIGWFSSRFVACRGPYWSNSMKPAASCHYLTSKQVDLLYFVALVGLFC